MRITKDGLAWKEVDSAKAFQIFNSGVFPLYILHYTEKEELVENIEQLTIAIEKDLAFGIEAGNISGEDCRFVLESKYGIFTRNLWSVDDVKAVLDCEDDAICLDILENALTSELIFDEIWFAIKDKGCDKGFNITD